MEKTKVGFFKKILISLKDFEKYIIFAAEDTKENLKYLLYLVLIFSVVLTTVYTIKISKDGFGSIIGDEYKDILATVNAEAVNEGKEEVNLDEVVTIVKREAGVFAGILFISLALVYFITAIIDAGVLAILGKIIAMLLGMKIELKATFNMGIHALTLPIILQTIYIPINILTGFEIKYFGWMYTTISYIYILVAILMIKTEFINRQREMAKMQEEPKVEEIKEETKEEKKDNNENKKDDENKDNKEENDKKEDKDNLAPEA